MRVSNILRLDDSIMSAMFSCMFPSMKVKGRIKSELRSRDLRREREVARKSSKLENRMIDYLFVGIVAVQNRR